MLLAEYPLCPFVSATIWAAVTHSVLLYGASPVVVFPRRTEGGDEEKSNREKHPTGTIYVTWDNASRHEEDEVEDLVRAAAGRLVLLYLPTYSPWLNPIEMLWRHLRWEVTHCELFETKKALLTAAQECFNRFNQCPQKILSVIGSNAKKVA